MMPVIGAAMPVKAAAIWALLIARRIACRTLMSFSGGRVRLRWRLLKLPGAVASKMVWRRGVGDEGDTYRSRRRPPREMVVERRQHDPLGRADAVDLIGAGTHRIHVEAGAFFLESLPADDRRGDRRDHAAVEEGIGPLEDEADQVWLGRVHAVDVGVQRLLVGHGAAIEMAGEGEQHVVRRHLAIAFVELDAPAQAVGPGARVG
jgi:hypothetical protein